MKTRFLSLFIAVLTIFSVTSCSSDNPDTDTATDAAAKETTAETQTETEPEADPETARMAELLADVPTGSYDGYTFTMLNNISNYAYTMMTAEALTGEGLNDAIYNRNLAVAEKLNISIQEMLMEHSLVTSEMKKAIQANDTTYDCFWNESNFISPFATDGSLLNIHDIPAINLDKPWWDGRVLEEMQIGPCQYFLVGDLHLMFKESFWMVGFNKNLLDENGLFDKEGFGDPYSLVRNGTWTMDRMAAFMQEVGKDVNGDAVMDASDQFGVTCHTGCVIPLFIGMGEQLVERDEEQIPRLTEPDDRYYQAYETIVRTMFAPEADYVCIAGKTPELSRYPDEWIGIFRTGRSLFFLQAIGGLKVLRDMDAEFGIVPFPKLDEKQEEYHSYIAHSAAFCGIPIQNADPERTGVILENFGAQSYGDLRHTYMDSTLNFKYIRDQESREMLQLIFQTGQQSLADLLNVRTIHDEIVKSASSGNMEFASSFKRVRKASNKIIERSVSGFMKEK